VKILQKSFWEWDYFFDSHCTLLLKLYWHTKHIKCYKIRISITCSSVILPRCQQQYKTNKSCVLFCRYTNPERPNLSGVRRQR